jgi:hypothetical protein
MAITGGASGTGNGVVSVNLTSNPDQTERTGTLTVAGQAVAVVQSGQAPCTIDISPASASYNPPPATGSFAVSTAEHCQWSATSSASWLAVTSGGSGTGNGNVSYSVDRNRESSSRTATIVVGQRTFTVTQFGEDPGPCTIDISPTTASFSAAAAAGNVSITAPQHCQWSATSNASWLVVTSGSTGTGSGSIAFAVERNQDTNPRTGAIDISGRTFTVTQLGEAATCDYSVSPIQFAPCMASTTLTAAVTAQPGCTWTAEPDDPWLTVIGGQTGSGSGTIVFRVSDNYAPPRQGVVKVRWPTPTAGQNLHVSQGGCHYAVSTTAISILAAGGPGTFNVITAPDPISCGGATQTGCLWTAQADVPWIRITTSMPQTEDNPVSFTVDPNPGTAARTGTITVRDKTVVITQAGS